MPLTVLVFLSPDEVRAYQPEPPTTGPDLALIRAKRRMVETGQWDGAQGAMILQPPAQQEPLWARACIYGDLFSQTHDVNRQCHRSAVIEP
jgi:hypothetical protein